MCGEYCRIGDAGMTIGDGEPDCCQKCTLLLKTLEELLSSVREIAKE